MGFFDFITGGDKPPPVSDPQQLAKEQELLDRYNIESPFGRRFFSKDDQGREVLNIEETPYQRALRGQQEMLASDFLRSLAGGEDRFAEEARRIGDVTFERGLKRLEPILEKARRRTDVRLSSQGIPTGSEARRDVIDELQAGESDLLTELAQSSELAASSEQDRLRRLAANEAATFLGGQFSGIDPSFFGGVAGTNRAGIIQTGEQAQQARNQTIYDRNIAFGNKLVDIGSALAAPATGGMSSFMGSAAGAPMTGGMQGATRGSGLQGFFGGGSF